MLTDVHEAYRTVAIAPDATPNRALYTARQSVHGFSFDSDAVSADSGGIVGTLGKATVAIGVVAVATLAASAAWTAARTRLGRR